MKFLPILFLLELALCFRSLRRSWITPSWFVCAFWFAYLFCSALTIERFDVLGLSVLVVLIATVGFGAFLGEHGKDSQIGKPIEPVRAVKIFTLLSLAGIAWFIRYSVNEYDLDYSPFSLLSVGGIWTQNRYSGIFEPWPYRVLVVWFHPACLFGGILFATATTKKRKLLCLFTLFPSLLCTVLTGARAAFIIGLACWLSGYFATLRQIGKEKTIRLKKIVWACTIASMLLGAFILVDAIRATQTGDKTLATDIDESHIVDYVFGSPPAFAKWYSNGDPRKYTLGAYTFPTIFEMIGAKNKHMGVYEEEVIVVPGYFTNVYTAFRGLVQDFTLPGALLLCLLIGYAGGRAYYQRSPYVSAFYGFVIFSPLVNIFFVNGTILAWLLLAYFLNKPQIKLFRSIHNVVAETGRVGGHSPKVDGEAGSSNA